MDDKSQTQAVEHDEDNSICPGCYFLRLIDYLEFQLERNNDTLQDVMKDTNQCEGCIQGLKLEIEETKELLKGARGFSAAIQKEGNVVH